MRWQSEVTRRTLLSHTAAGTAALAAGAMGAYAQASKPPNIVFILADDLGYADVSCNGRRDYSTPNIDRIAERGIRLPRAYANSAVCSATRLALITGRYQYRLPLGLEEPLAGKADVGLPPEHPTLPSLLRAAGALLIVGLGLVNVANAEWAHVIGGACFLAFIATAFRVAVPLS